MGEPQERKTGVCKWFNAQKGFGFITLHESEEEVFVHQSNIDTTGYRSLQQGEEVEFDLVIGDDGKQKAFHVTGPQGTPPKLPHELQGSLNFRGGFSGRGGRDAYTAMPGAYSHAAMAPGGAYPAYPQVAHGRGRGAMAAGNNPGYWGHDPAAAAAWGFYPVPPAAAAAAAAAAAGGYYPTVYPRRGGFFPGGRNWVGARPPPPGQPGISSGLQVVVHNLPWDCTWQQLKDAFGECGDIDRADVVFDSRGRSRGFGIVRFPNKESAEEAVEKMNNASIGGRVVSVRIDRFA